MSCADLRARATLVLDDHRLSPGFGKPLRYGPCNQVGGASGRIGHDDGDGSCRIALRLCRSLAARQAEKYEQDSGNLPHVSLLSAGRTSCPTSEFTSAAAVVNTFLDNMSVAWTHLRIRVRA